MTIALGQSVNSIDRNIEDRVTNLKESTHYQQVQDKLSAQRDNKGIWVKNISKQGVADYYLDITKLSSKNFFTSVSTHGRKQNVPLLIKMVMGQKIQLKDKVEGLIDSYKKAVVQAKSHNLIMARLGGIKMATMSFVLSLLGVPVEELKKMKKQAIEDAITENLALFEENVYNIELMSVLSGAGKKSKAQMSILEEIQTQLLTQAKRLGIDEYYTKERLLEMKVKVCKDIYFKFKEEESNMQYELDYYTNM